jgi:disulfide bond formation protein DsbB
MYPLVIVLGVAALRRDRWVWITALVFVVVGAPLSLYHWLVERVPAFEESSSCSATAPCSTPWFEKLGFVTLAWMAMSSFLLIGVLMVCTWLGGRETATAEAAGTVDA